MLASVIGVFQVVLEIANVLPCHGGFAVADTGQPPVNVPQGSSNCALLMESAAVLGVKDPCIDRLQVPLYSMPLGPTTCRVAEPAIVVVPPGDTDTVDACAAPTPNASTAERIKWMFMTGFLSNVVSPPRLVGSRDT